MNTVQSMAVKRRKRTFRSILFAGVAVVGYAISTRDEREVPAPNEFSPVLETEQLGFENGRHDCMNHIPPRFLNSAAVANDPEKFTFIAMYNGGYADGYELCDYDEPMLDFPEPAVTMP